MKSPQIINTMAAAMDSASEGICITDPYQPDNPLIYVNKGFLKLTGYSEMEVIGRNVRFLQGPDTDQLVIQKVRQAISKQQPIQVEIINYRKDGEAFWNKMSISPVYNERQELTHFIGIQNDITAIKQKEVLEKQLERQKLMAEIVLEAQEQERRELGKELHDNINQILTTAKLYLNMAETSEELRMDMIIRSRILINNTVEEIRRLSGLLVGPELKESNLKDSLEDLINNIKPAVPFELNYNDQHLNEHKLSDKKKVVLYRVVQEQITNIIKHAMASQVFINFEEKPEELCLSIKDDGVGFNTEDLKSGIGLRNISSRLELINGEMKLITEPGKGCEMICEIPYS